jgi:phosphatidyl-myo-inositol dimannoside synthase
MDGGWGVRVLYLTDSLSDLDGVGRYAMCLIEACQKLRPDLEPEILLARKHRPTSSLVPKDWSIRVALPPDYFYYMSPLRFAAWRALGTLQVWRSARGVDLVHAIKDYPHSLIGVDGASLAGVPCVATGHGTYTIQPLLSERHGARALSTSRRMGGLISVSNYTKSRWLEAVPPGTLGEGQPQVVPNCVDAERYVHAPEIGERPWHHFPFSLTIGEVKQRKGHHLGLGAWLKAAQKFPDWHHVIVGRCSGDDYERDLRQRIEAAGMTSRVHVLGNISEDEKVDLLQRAEIFLHTPITADDGGFEGFGIVYLEASAAGTAVIGTNDCGAEDAILDSVTGYLVPQTEGSVQAALERLMADGELRQTLGAQGRLHAGANTWEHNARAVLELYDQVLARNT